METTNSHAILELIPKLVGLSISSLVTILIAMPLTDMTEDRTIACVLACISLYLLNKCYKKVSEWKKVEKGFKYIPVEDKEFLRKRFSSNLYQTTLIKQKNEYKSEYLIHCGILIKSSLGTDEGYVGYKLSERAIKYIYKNNLFN